MSGMTGPTHSDRLVLVWLLLVAVLGFGVRLAYYFESDDPTFIHPIVDSSEYDFYASKIAHGQNPWSGAFTRPPLYPIMLGAVYAITGKSWTAVYLFHALLGGVVCGLTMLLGCRFYGRRVGIVSGVLVALYGPMIFFDVRLLASPLVVALYLVLLLLAGRVWESPRWQNLLPCGLVAGVAALARPTIAPFFLLALAMGLLIRSSQRRQVSKGVVAVIILAAGSILPIIPAAARNFVASGEWVPISTLGSLNLYIGNNPEAERTIAIRPGPDWDRMNRLPHAEGKVSSAEKEAFFLGQVTSYMRENPVAFLKNIARKTRLYFNGREIPRNFDIQVHRGFSTILSGLTGQLGPLHLPFGLLLPLGLVGLIVGLRDYPQRWLLLGFVTACAVSVILFFNGSRYRMPAVPVLTVAAVGLTSLLIRQLASGLKRSAMIGFGAAFVVSVVVNIPVAAPTDAVNFEADFYVSLAGRHTFEGDYKSAINAYRQALLSQPDDASVLGDLSNLHGQMGDRPAALNYARLAVQTDDGLIDAHLQLASAMYGLAMWDQAIAQLVIAESIEPSHPRVHNLLGQIAATQGRYEQAAEHFDRSLHFENAEPSIYTAYARMLTKTEAYQKAVDLLERGLGQSRSVDLKNDLAWLLATCPQERVRDAERAMVLVGQFLDGAGASNPYYLDTAAAAHAGVGDFKQALRLAAKAHRIALEAGLAPLAKAVAARLRDYEQHNACRNSERRPTSQ